MKTINSRTTEYEVNNLFLNRHSPRAMSGQEITKDELMTLFEAARWAPSSMNTQPWRFIYAMKNTPEFEKLFSLLFEGNRTWSNRASALILVISKKNLDNEKLNISHSLDTGAAWENLALQATTIDLVVHGLGGFDHTLAKNEFSVPNDYHIEMMIAIGKPGKIEDLPEPLRVRETPSQRKALKEIVFEGKFKE